MAFNADALESYLIPADESVGTSAASLGIGAATAGAAIIGGRYLINQRVKKLMAEGKLKNPAPRKSYVKMSNKELAKIMYDRLSDNPNLKLGKASDPAVDNQYGFNKSMTAQYDGANSYEEYAFDGIPVLVIKNGIGKTGGWDNPSFNIWAYVNDRKQLQLISTDKKSLIKSFEREDSSK